MDRIRVAWRKATDSPVRIAILPVAAAVAVVIGVWSAGAVTSLRDSGTASLPATEAATPSSSERPSTTPTPSPSPSLSPVPSATPSLTPGPVPSSTSCEDYEFAGGEVTVGTYAELRDGIVGTWAGCVTTPWVAPFWVTITFRSDGTYSGVAAADVGEPAFYYGTDEDSPEKTYEVDDIQGDLEGLGHIDIFFRPGTTNRGALMGIRLMGNQLQFEFFHRSQYGPLLYQLYKVGP